MRNLTVTAMCWVCLTPAFLGAARADSATETPVRLDALLWGSPATVADSIPLASPAAVSVAAVREFSEAGGPVWIGFGDAVVGAGPFALLAAAWAAVRRRRQKRELLLQTLYEVDETVPEAADEPSPSTKIPPPRVLPSNPYLDASAPERLGRQIQNAAEASLEFDRILGVVYFDIGVPPMDENGQPLPDWAYEAGELLGQFKRALRQTDHVAFLNDRELVACIALLPGMTELLAIAERLRRMGQSMPAFSGAFDRPAGVAIFPLCGYRGEELIAHARADFLARKSVAKGLRPPERAFLEHARESGGAAFARQTP